LCTDLPFNQSLLIQVD